MLIFAAASLQTAIDELAAPALRATGSRVRASYAASSALARQIENGAPADLFISADLEWMDYVADRRLIRAASRVNLLGNRLVLIAPEDRPSTLKIAPGFPLAAALGRDRLAVANPAAVPAGKYARAALTALGVWESVASKVAAAENVRAALMLVSRGEAPLGIVYRTDARDRSARGRRRHVSRDLPSAHRLPGGHRHHRVVWRRERVLDFLKSAEARAVFETTRLPCSPP